jgi:uncharacterized protein YvpB
MQRAGRFAAACWVVLFVLTQLLAATAQAAGDVSVGREATVQAPGGLNLRNDPSAQSEVLTTAGDGDFVHVIAGPRVEGDLTWYAVEYEGFVGWAAGPFLAAPRDRGAVTSRGNRPAGTAAASSAWLPVPYYSQFDGTAYSRANCGPASLLMALSAFGKWVPVTDIRRAANRMQGTAGWYDAGVGIEVLADLAAQYGMSVHWGGNYDQWTFDEVRDALRRGHLVIPQVHLASLPGQERSSRGVDHYIVITGFDDGRFYYNDPAFSGQAGHGMAISQERLALAWKRSDYPFAAFSVGPGADMNPLVAPARPAVPRQSSSALAAVEQGGTAPAPAPVLAPARPDDQVAAMARRDAETIVARARDADALALKSRDGDGLASRARDTDALSAPAASAEPALVAAAETERSFVPTWSGAVTHGDVRTEIGRVPLDTGADASQLWTMLAGAVGLAVFGARRQFSRLGVRLTVPPLRRPAYRYAAFSRR